MMRTLFLLALASGLAACSEKPQTLGAMKSDAPAFQGTGSNFMAPGWKAGDKAGWANHLKARASYGQDDHARAPK